MSDACPPGSLGALVGHTRPVTCLAIAPDGYTLLSGSEDGTVRMWDVRNGQSLRSFAHGAKGPVSSILVLSSGVVANVMSRSRVGGRGGGAPSAFTPLAPFHKYASQSTLEERAWEGPHVRLACCLPESNFAAAAFIDDAEGASGASAADGAASLSCRVGDAALLSQLREQLSQSQADAQRWQSLHTQLMEFTARKVGDSAMA